MWRFFPLLVLQQMVNERTYSDTVNERKLSDSSGMPTSMGVFWPFMSTKTEGKSSDFCGPTTNLCLYFLSPVIACVSRLLWLRCGVLRQINKTKRKTRGSTGIGARQLLAEAALPWFPDSRIINHSCVTQRRRPLKVASLKIILRHFVTKNPLNLISLEEYQS